MHFYWKEIDSVSRHTAFLWPLKRILNFPSVKEVIDLNFFVKSQERELQIMKIQQLLKDNVINSAGSKVDNVAKSNCYLSMSLQDHGFQNNDRDRKIYREFYYTSVNSFYVKLKE